MLIQKENNIIDVGIYVFLGLAVFCTIVLVIIFIIGYRKWLRY